MKVDDPSAVWTFDTDVRVYAAAPHKLAFYEADNDSAYLATDEALDLRDWS